MRPEVFAAERGSRLESSDAELLPVVERALSHYSASAAWYEPIITAARGLWDETFSGAAGDVPSASAASDFNKGLRESLAKTTAPADAGEGQAERIAYWVSTYTANHAEHHAALANKNPELRWVTRHDDRVRPIHAAIDGQTIQSGSKFDVDGYKLRFPGDPVGPPEVWINCRCLAQRVGEGSSMAGNATAFTEIDAPLVAAGAEDDSVTPEQGQLAQDDLVDAPQPTPFHGVAAPTDTPSGDGRQLSGTGFSTRTLPLPFNYQKGHNHGGDPGMAVTVGRIDAIWLDPETGLVNYTGVFSPNIPEAGDAIQHIVDGTMRGVSVDVDNADGSMAEGADGETGDLLVFSAWRIAGITMVAVPAFQEAYVALGAHPDQPTADPAVTAASFAPGTHDGPGWITEPVPTGRIRDYWIKGEGRAKIAWGVDGDFDRCRAHIGKYVKPQYLAGTCANMHKEATGAWPGHAPGESIVAAAGKMAASINLVASVHELPPGDWFHDPQLSGPTPFTVMENGRVFGHVATWGVCHIGMQNVCTVAPTSPSHYAYYRTGAIDTTLGEVAVGQITMGSGHADIRANSVKAVAHYDNVGTAVADVAAGEDAYGIWVAGALRPTVTEDQRLALKAASLSGDWRSIQGNLEMVAALAVNVPGFPIPRNTSLAASAAHQDALVAAGVIIPKEAVMADTLPATPNLPAPPKPPAVKPNPDDVAKHGDDSTNSAIAAIDSHIDKALAALSGVDTSSLPPEVQEALSNLKAGDTAIDALMKSLGIPDPDKDDAPPAHDDAPPKMSAAIRAEIRNVQRIQAASARIRTLRLEKASRLKGHQ